MTQAPGWRAFICSLLNDRRPFCEGGSWTFVSHDSFAHVRQRAMGAKNPGSDVGRGWVGGTVGAKATEVQGGPAPSEICVGNPGGAGGTFTGNSLGLVCISSLVHAERSDFIRTLTERSLICIFPPSSAPQIAKGQKTKPGA